MASKQDNEQKDLYAQQVDQFRKLIASPELRQRISPAQLKLLSAMGPAEGIKVAQKFLEDAGKTTVVGKKLVRSETGQEVARDDTVDPFTLGQGDTRFGPDGKAIAKGEAKPIEPGSQYLADALAEFGKSPTEDFSKLPAPVRKAITDRAEELRKSSATNVKSSVNLGENEFAKGIGTGAAKVLEASQVTADAAAKDRPLIRQALQQLDKGVISGTGANARLQVAQFLNTVGLTNDPSVEATQVYMATTAGRVLPIAKTLGSGSGFSDKDREFLQNIMAGNIEQSPGALKRLLNLQEKAAEGTIKAHNARVDNIPAKDIGDGPRAMFKVVDPITGGLNPTKTVKIDGHNYTAKLNADGHYVVTVNGEEHVLP